MFATSRILVTTELLEEILLDLPSHDLLLSQRVSRTWQTTILAPRHLFRCARALPQGTSPQPPTRYPYLPRLRKGDIDLKGRDVAALDIRGPTEMYICQPPIQRLEIVGRPSSIQRNNQRNEIYEGGAVQVKHLARRLRCRV